MKRKTAISISFLSAIIVSGVIAFSFIPPFFESECENEIIKSVKNPINSYVAILFSRKCGATTNYSTNVSIIKQGEKLLNEAGNIYISDGYPKRNGINWLNENTLHIGGASYKSFKQKNSFSNIEIQY
jgi:hypothetical protein